MIRGIGQVLSGRHADDMDAESWAAAIWVAVMLALIAAAVVWTIWSAAT